MATCSAVVWSRAIGGVYVSDMGVAARSVSEEFSSGCEGRSGSGGGSTGAPADQDHRPDHKQHRDRTPDDRDEGTVFSPNNDLD